jgi:hypothetical protein
LAPSRTVTLQELLLQGSSDEKSALLQSLEQLRKVAHEPHPISSFQDAQRSRKWEIPASSDRSSDLFVDQEQIDPQFFRQQNGLPFSTVQGDRKGDVRRFRHCLDLKPWRHGLNSTPHCFRRSHVCKLLVYRDRDENLIEQLSEEMFLFDRD